MDALRSASYALALNDEVIAKIRAYNLIGWSGYSPQTATGGTITTEPGIPPSPVAEGANTDDTQLHVTWQALTGDDAGQEAITMYEVQWDAGSAGASWATLVLEVVGNGFTYTFTQTAGIDSGAEYRLRYRATNLHGTGGWSATAQITASTVPAQLAAATTANSGTDVVVSWPATSSARGAAVTAYRVLLKRADGTFQAVSECDGATAASVADRTCSVPMTRFTDAPFSLPIGALVVATVEALNAKGYADPSPANTAGALAQTEPTQGPSAYRGAATSASQLEITWDALTTSPDDGGAAVTLYEVYWDAGSADPDQATWSLAATTDAATQRAIRTSAISAGTTYSFAVKARNVHGLGPAGPAVALLAATAPGAPTALTAGAATASTLSFSWSAPASDGGAAVTDYTVRKKDPGAAFFLVHLTTTSGATSVTVTGLAASASYGFTVAAVNAVGEGSASSELYMSTTA